MAPPQHFRVVGSARRPGCGSELLELRSGDAFLVSLVDGGLLVSLDDVDGSAMPTARLTRSEARRLALTLTRFLESR